MDGNTDIGKLVSELKQLFNNQNSFLQPSDAKSTSGYQAPIKGNWGNSGGFSPNAVRPNGRKGHFGVDMRAAGGTAVYPLADGIVTNVGSNSLGGNVINITHADGVRSYYAHLGSIKVFKGDKVNLNTVIGTVGASGNAKDTFPHIHFQVWKNDQLQDPAQYFSIPIYSNPKNEQTWLSEEAKQEAKSFNINNHLSKRKIAFISDLNYLVKVADLYSKLT